MIDRLEELLAALADEDEDENEEENEEEREGLPALADPAAPGRAAGEEDGGGAVLEHPPLEDGGGAVPAGDGWNRTRDTPAGPAAGKTDRSAAAAEGEGEDASPEEARRDGPGWTAAAPEAEAVRRRAPGDRSGQPGGAAAGPVRMAAAEAPETALGRPGAGQGGAPARAVRHEAGRGLEELYRQAVQAVRPSAPQAAGTEGAGRTLRTAAEPERERTAGLTVDELDRAVRRDSRRYDGGMTIF